MAVAVFNSSVNAVNVIFPGKKNEIWYKVDQETWTPYHGGLQDDIPVDIHTVS